MHKTKIRKTLFPTDLTRRNYSFQFKQKKNKKNKTTSSLSISRTLKKVQEVCYDQQEKFFKIVRDPDIE